MSTDLLDDLRHGVALHLAPFNLQDGLVEVFSEPSTEDVGYDLQTVFRKSDCVSISIGSLGNLSFDVDQVV